MIGYPTSLAELWTLIDAEDPDWRTTATTKTAAFFAAGKYNEEDGEGSWGNIKAVYMRLQKSKCGFCERQLESVDFGRIEHDVEHFRPKNRVRAYPPRQSNTNDPRAAYSYPFAMGGSYENGYHQLAYHPLNYLTSCKTCNTRLKSDFFPIAGTRMCEANNPEQLRDEAAYLIYPIGNIDVSPQSLIGFNGITAIPLAESGPSFRRARVTIDLFQLNGRESLRKGRAQQIVALRTALNSLELATDPEERSFYEDCIDILLSPDAAHSNCSRCFERLYKSDKPSALAIASVALEYLKRTRST